MSSFDGRSGKAYIFMLPFTQTGTKNFIDYISTYALHFGRYKNAAAKLFTTS